MAVMLSWHVAFESIGTMRLDTVVAESLHRLRLRDGRISQHKTIMSICSVVKFHGLYIRHYDI